MNRKLKKLVNKSNNRGASLVLVIVVVTFISILATMLLYIAGNNYLMKITELNTKKNFYATETALEEAKEGLCLICAEAAEDAYVDTMVRYSVSSSYSRYETFEQIYLQKLEEAWDEEAAAVSASGIPGTEDYLTVLKSYVEDKYKSCISFSTETDEHGDPLYDGTLDTSMMASGYIYLRGIVVEYTENDFTTQITTDIVFTIPEMNWSVNESYKTENSEATETKNNRNNYDISEYVNYYNWQKTSN